MRFLGLTFVQSALLAFATTAGIVALYFLKHRRRKIVVSSTQLWRKVLENRLDNSLFERLRRYGSILLAVITGLLVAMAIAQPEIEWLTGASRNTVVVLDTSPTMLTRRSDGRTRWQHAAEQALSIVESGAGSDRFRVADTSAQFDSPFLSDRAELRRLIERMHPVIGPTRFPGVDSPEVTNVVLLTDGISPLDAPEDAAWISVFEEAPNVGITAFEIRSMPTAPLAYEGYLEVFNSGRETRDVEINVSGAGRQRIAKTVRIASGRSYKETMDLSRFDGGGIRAAVRSDGDAFSPDDLAYAYLPVKRRARTLLVTRGNRFLENALRLDRLIDLTVVDPQSYAGGREFDAFVFDRFAPVEPPERPALIVGVQNVPWLKGPTGVVAGPRFESWLEDHDVLRHVSLFDVAVDRATRIDPSGVTVLAASSDGTPLIVASERPRWIQMTFDLQSSDFPYHPAFPIFLDNAIAWFGRERLALRRTPGIVDIPFEDAEIRTIDGKTLPAQTGLGNTVFEADPGLYVAGKGELRQYIAVNFASRDFSDVNDSTSRESRTTSISSTPILRRELWFYMLCGALLLIGVEWYTYHRRITL